MRFKLLYEAKKISQIDFTSLKKIFDKLFDKSKTTETTKSTETKLYSKTRVESREQFVNDLKASKIPYTEEISAISSIPVVKISGTDGKIHKFIFKPIGGGGAHETTLNSSITELIPALMIMHKIKPKGSNIETLKMLKEIDLKKSPVFVAATDVDAGKDVLERCTESKKFEEKFDNAVAIYNYLKDLNADKKIKNIWWAYRTKPAGVKTNNPGDLIIEFNDKAKLGISLKAGEETSKEPQLNTFVAPIKQYFDGNLNKLNNELWSKIYSKIPGLELNDFLKKTDTFKNSLRSFESKNSKTYNELYDKALDIIKVSVENDFNNDKKFIAFIKDRLLGSEDDVPVKVIKAVGRTYKEIKDKNEIDDAIPTIVGVDVKHSKTAKQDMYVILRLANNSDLNMKWSIRTNKPIGSNKLHQVPNLSVKYNGLVQNV